MTDPKAIAESLVGPCLCIWCRHRRGATTASERRSIEARERAFAAQDKRLGIAVAAELEGGE